MTGKQSVGGVQVVLMVLSLMGVLILISSCCQQQECPKQECPKHAPQKNGSAAPDRSAYRQSAGPSQIDWNRLTSQAKSANKPVYIEFTATWCPNCREFERDTLAKPKVRQALGQVIYARANIDREADLARRCNITGVPAGVLLKIQDGQLRQIDRHVGGLNEYTFIRFLEQ